MVDLNDIIGTKVGRWYIESRAPNRGNKIYYNCICDCGTQKEVQRFQLLHGLSMSCGCLSTELAKQRIKHGCKKTRLYHTWVQIKDRCNNPKCGQYKNYGGRGIKICDEWDHDFIAFQNWSYNHGYCDNLTIDRIDVNSDYCPENCRWVDMITQQNNRRNNKRLFYRGENKTIAEWSRETGIGRSTIWNRLYMLHWSIEDALSIPRGCKRGRAF